MVESISTLKKALSNINHNDRAALDDPDFFYSRDFVARCKIEYHNYNSWQNNEFLRSGRIHPWVDLSFKAQPNCIYLSTFHF